MEVIPSATASGKFLVTFNGAVIPCHDSSACPGASVCAQNASWAPPGMSMCSCDIYSWFTGPTCQDTGPGTRMVLGILVTALMLTVTSLLSTVWALVTLIRIGKFDRKSPLTITTCISIVDTILYMMGLSLTLYGVSSFPTAFDTTTTPGQKLEPYQRVQLTLLGVGFGFTTLSAVFVSLVFISLAEQAQKLTRQRSGYVKTGSQAYFAVVVFVIVPGAAVPALYTFAVFIVFVVLLLFIAVFGFSVVKTRQLYTGSTGTASSSSDNHSKAKTLLEVTLFRIFRTSVMFLVISVVAVLLFFVGFFGPARVNSTYAPPDFARFGSTETAYRLFVLTFSLMQCATASYIVSTVVQLRRTAKQLAAGSLMSGGSMACSLQHSELPDE